MHVLFLNSVDRGTYGGMEEWIRLTAAGLLARNVRVSVAGRTGAIWLERIRPSVPGGTIIGLPISGDLGPLVISRLRGLLSRERIDLLVANFNKDVRLGGLAAQLHPGTKVVWSPGLNLTGTTLAHRWLTPRLIDAVLVPSQSLKKELVAAGYIDPEIVTVIPIGIESVTIAAGARPSIRERLGISVDACLGVTVARFVDQKGHRYLIEAMALLAERAPDFHMLLLGSGEREAALRAQAEQLGVTSRLHWAGMVDDVASYIAAADLMVHPSIEEPFGIALVEGMRAGLPVVASCVGGIPEVVGDEGVAVLVPPRDPATLAEALFGIISHPERRAQMSQAAHDRFTRQFTQQVMTDRIHSYFAELCTAASRPHGAA